MVSIEEAATSSLEDDEAETVADVLRVGENSRKLLMLDAADEEVKLPSAELLLGKRLVGGCAEIGLVDMAALGYAELCAAAGGSENE